MDNLPALLLVISFAAFLFSTAVTPVARRVALAIGIVAQPSARKTHANPTPLLGGAAMYAAFIATFLIAIYFFGAPFFLNQALGILLGATWVAFLGVWDDWRPLPPYTKLAGQFFAALILIVTDVQVGFLHQPVLNVLLTALWVVGITNALNLLDNMDGLSGGIAAIAAGFFALLAATNGQFLVGSLAAALLGASIGFLIYNFNPASIFMGDAGSLFIGFLLAAVGIKLRFPAQSDTITWMIPLFVLGVPVFDTTLVVLSRSLRGKNPLTTPGKDHLSHRLVGLGLSVRQAVITIYLLGIVLGAIALGIQYANAQIAYTLLGATILLALGALVWFIKNEQ